MTETSRLANISLLGLAGAASLLELGPILTLIQSGEGLVPILTAGLAYQTGNAAPRPSWLIRRSVAAPTVLIAVLALLFMTPGTAGSILSIAILSWTLQAIRRSIAEIHPDEVPSTIKKRSARTIGFIAAGLVPLFFWVGALLSILLIATTQARPMGNTKVEVNWPLKHPLEWAMLTHQLHYFCYALAVTILIADPQTGGIEFVGFWFAAGWISYLSAESLWHRFDSRHVLVLGHLFLALVLILMWNFSDVPSTVIVLWILSGFGGGTVYCLTQLHQLSGLPHDRLGRVEDIGHILGVAIALFCAAVLNWKADALPIVSAVWALITVILVLLSLAHENGDLNKPKKAFGGPHANQRD